MLRRKVFYMTLFLVIALCFCFTNVNASNNDLTLSKDIVSLTYKNIGYNTYKYNSKGAVTCSSNDPSYVTCLVDSTNKRIVVTPLKVTTNPVTITVNASSKMQQVQNSASIKYEGEESINLTELSNPVIKKSDAINVPNTGSNAFIIGIVVGVLLLGYGSYIISKKFGFDVFNKIGLKK